MGKSAAGVTGATGRGVTRSNFSTTVCGEKSEETRATSYMFIWDGHVLQLAVGLSYNQLNEGRVTKSLIQVFAKHSSEPPRVPRNRGTGGTFSQSVSQSGDISQLY